MTPSSPDPALPGETQSGDAAATAWRDLLGATEAPVDFGDRDAEYQALAAGAAVVPLPGRTQFELRGEDRQTFLHNLSTNDVRRLGDGQGCEAFLLDAKGHVRFHVLAYAGSRSLVLETVPGAGQALLAHLDRYLIRERVELHDRTRDWVEVLVAGRRASEVLRSWGCDAPPRGLLAHGWDGAARRAYLRRVDWTAAEGWLASVPAAGLVALWRDLVAAGCRPCGAAAFDAARLEVGVPWYGRDISEQNLPQEVARDDRAISFVKGCYLGQETVARIDALGHVNRVLVGLRFAGRDVPAPGEKLAAVGQTVGAVTSAAWSPGAQAPIALGYVRTGRQAPGTTLDSPVGPCHVVEFATAARESSG